jgi:hypothetical protein
VDIRAPLIAEVYEYESCDWTFAASLIVAFAGRRFVTNWSGLTFTRSSGTIYVPLNIVVFWLSIVVAIILCLVSWGWHRKIL